MPLDFFSENIPRDFICKDEDKSRAHGFPSELFTHGRASTVLVMGLKYA
jgi:hypothetical protein